jgi:hypothetical protein
VYNGISSNSRTNTRSVSNTVNKHIFTIQASDFEIVQRAPRRSGVFHRIFQRGIQLAIIVGGLTRLHWQFIAFGLLVRGRVCVRALIN